MSRIVIVGAGFVGLSTARRLRRLLPAATISLIDAKDRFLFAPRLIDLLEDEDYPTTSLRADLRAIAKRDGFGFIQGKVVNIDRETRTLTYTPPTSQDQPSTLTYDALVLCQGAQACFYGISGAAEHTIPLKSEEDVHHLHDQVRSLLEKAKGASTDETRKKLLSFVAVGAGASGVEALCALKQFTERVCDRDYTALKPYLSWTIVQGGPQILPGFPLELVNGAKTALERQGIAVKTGATVTAIQPDQVDTTQGSFLAGCILWTAGIEAVAIPLTPEVHTERGGYLPVDQYFVVAPQIFGAGDVVVYREGNMVIPKNAQTAMRMADTLAENVARSLRGSSLTPFRYSAKGNIVTVGDTGFLDMKFMVLQTRLAHVIRNLFYRLRFWQMTGM